MTAEARGYDVSFLNSTSLDMSYVDRARYRGFDGVAIVCCLDYDNPKVAELLRSSIKVVTIDYLANNRTAILSGNTEGMHCLWIISFLWDIRRSHISAATATASRDKKAGRLLQEHGGAWDYRSG